ncbi:amino acid/polyamine transporter I [Melanogaster broomeanus]|nr:amino acid/polyamine transporter I [Melanogaster broomeanus]
MLSDPKDAPLTSWITGWFSLLGQVAVTTGINFACANFLSTVSTLGTAFTPGPSSTIGIYAAVLVSQGFINTFGVHLLKYLNNISVWWHGVTRHLYPSPCSDPPVRRLVFRTFIDGLLLTAALAGASVRAMGFDASSYMTEETHNAALTDPMGIIMSIDLAGTLDSATGQPVAQIFLDTVGEKGAIVLMVIVVGATYFCGTLSMTSHSRMMFAFARDGGMGLDTLFSAKSTPRQACLVVGLHVELLLGLPSLGSSVAFAAATSIATIGLYISYGIPIALRVVCRQRFKCGPFDLGAFSLPVAICAVTWVACIAIVLILPQVNPVGFQTLNYAIVVVGVVILYGVGFWFVSARKWFVGPVKTDISPGDGSIKEHLKRLQRAVSG